MLTPISFTAPVLRTRRWILQPAAGLNFLSRMLKCAKRQDGDLPAHIHRMKFREASEQWQLCSCSPLISNSSGGQCGLHNCVTPTHPEKPHQLNESMSLTRTLLNSWSVWQIVSAHYSGESFPMHNSSGNLNFYIFESLWSSCSRVKCLCCLCFTAADCRRRSSSTATSMFRDTRTACDHFNLLNAFLQITVQLEEQKQ